MNNSIRVAYENWVSKDRFERLLKMLAQYPCGISQIALFSSAVHTPLTLDELQRRADIMRERMKTAREAGFSAGINLLSTIGHHNEDLDNTLLHLGYQNITNIDGKICEGCFCMNDERFISNHIEPTYRILADANPEFIWIDDDVRYGHGDIGKGCFCKLCIDAFNRENNTDYNRESLRKALNSGDISVRKLWLKRNGDTIINLFEHIFKTVHDVSPDIILGFMTGERYMEGYDFLGFADALSENGKYDIIWRPGGGAYTDINFDEIIYKADDISRQVSLLPSYVKDIQSENENFPYQLIKKTPRSTACEAMLYMQSGCTGAAFNILPSETGEPIETVLPYLRTIDRYVPIYKAFTESVSGMKIYGIHSSWRPGNQAITPAGEWVKTHGGMYSSYNRELFMSGLPACFVPDCAQVVTLSGRSAASIPDDELKAILSGGVYLDASAIEYLTERGFGQYIGFKVGKTFPVDARELYTDAELNDGFNGCMRNCRQAFNKGDSYEIIPLSDDCVILGKLVDYHDNVLAECCTGIYENELGGRICAAGYFPYTWVSDILKVTQLKRVFKYLSHDSLCSYVDSYVRARNITYSNGLRIVTSIFNTTNDDLYDVRIAVKTGSNTAKLFKSDGMPITVTGEKIDGGYHIFTIDRISPYELAFIESSIV